MIPCLALLAVALGHLALLARLVAAARRGSPSAATALLLGLPLAGMAYDGSVLGLGPALDEGPQLQGLSFVRFVLHATLVPLWAVAAGELARDAGPPFARARAFRPVVAAFAISLVSIEVLELRGLELAPAISGGTLRYTRAAPGAPPVGALATLGAVLVFAPWISRRVLGAGLALLVLAGAPPSRVGPLPGNVGEILLAWALVDAATRTGRGAGASAPASSAGDHRS